MITMHSDVELVKQLRGELENFEEIAQHLIPKPGDLPRLEGMDVYGGTLALNGIVGGDHLIYVDFKQRFDLEARLQRAIAKGQPEVLQYLQRCQQTAGITMFDGSG